ncbi:Nuclease HARBI1 [Phytophthora megakarya]|uniref:Nuclease HARBI1 n=1 Tax=Phytophthora megakarya TaxID=4795 RepID=A0A225WI64_9STRA|nr:Nuclease HARBI1 [Phytophthora megakarya]
MFLFRAQDLRLSSQEDLSNTLRVYTARSFPGMIGSIDCMKWSWKNCPSAWRRAFQNVSRDDTVVLEAVATADLHIWLSFVEY